MLEINLIAVKNSKESSQLTGDITILKNKDKNEEVIAICYNFKETTYRRNHQGNNTWDCSLIRLQNNYFIITENNEINSINVGKRNGDDIYLNFGLTNDQPMFGHSPGYEKVRNIEIESLNLKTIKLSDIEKFKLETEPLQYQWGTERKNVPHTEILKGIIEYPNLSDKIKTYPGWGDFQEFLGNIVKDWEETLAAAEMLEVGIEAAPVAYAAD